MILTLGITGLQFSGGGCSTYLTICIRINYKIVVKM
jgi:hypothetical protein